MGHPFFKGLDWEKLRRKEIKLKSKPEMNNA
jgi:hypothetical protein